MCGGKTAAVSKSASLAGVCGATTGNQILKGSNADNGTNGGSTRDQIFVIGNPMLDISVDVHDAHLVTKYKMEPGLACLATPQ